MRIPNLGETELLVPLHDGVFEQPLWQTFLARLRGVSGASGAMLVLQSGEARERMILSRGECADKVAVLTSDMREGRVYALAELAEDAAGDLRALRLSDGGGLEAWLAILSDGEFRAEHSSLLAALAPHLRVALKVLSSLEREKARASMSEDAFARMNFGWIAIDARCRIVGLDGQAQRFLQRSGVLRRGPYDRLISSSPAADRALTRFARECSADRGVRPRAINLARDPWIDILVSPVRLPALAGDGEAVAMIYLRGDRSSSADRHEQLVDLFDLTPAEARLAWSLSQGASIAEAARLHGLTLETARYYSKRIYAKTGARGQVDLVRNILTGVLALA
ncbi:MAG: chemotaxis protein CheY [Sphingomonadaceae bacterium]|nr:chemotaxis protein CheY [Sphingomonadaceae bacterium]